MMTKLTYRKKLALGGLISGLCLAGAYVLEHQLHWEPCSLCLLQRYVLGALSGLFFLGALHNCKSMGRYFYLLSTILMSSLGMLLAIRHLWLQYFLPPEDSVSCTAGLEQLLEFQPVLSALKEVILNSKDCTQIDTLLTIPLSAWSLLGFSGFIAWSASIGYQQIKRRI